MQKGFASRGAMAHAIAILVLLGCTGGVQCQRGKLADVDPKIGTAHDGQTFPAVGVPFGMTSWTPETQSTEAKCVAPYYYKDAAITGFRGSHWLSGSCTQEYGSVTFMPTVGDLKVIAAERASHFDHDSEKETPALYSVFLKDYNTQVDLTGTTRSGMLRLFFPEKGARNLLVQPNARAGQGFVEVHPQQHEIVGYNPVVRIYQGAGQPAGFSGYFVIRFREAVASSGTWCGSAVHRGLQRQGSGCDTVGGFVTLAPGAHREVLVKVGTSFTSLDEARKNLDAEIPGWDFPAVQQAAETAWNKLLGRIEAEGGTPAQRTIFYTALYHSSLAPRIVSDADGTYNGFAQEGKLHHAQKGSAYYDDFSLWDTFRSLHPLLTILDPERDQQMIQSLIDKGEQGGFLPIFPTWNSYTSEMIGDHAVAVIYDAYAKGLRNFDVASAYRLVRQNALVTPPREQYVQGKGRRALESYSRLGYIPLEDEVLDAFHHREQVSRTLEYAYDDFLDGEFARALGHTEDAALFHRRSANWRNVFDTSTGFARGRHQDGTWITPFDPAKPTPYVTEAVPWQYSFFVPHDADGLIAAMGGSQKFVASLDGLFAAGLYDQGNEPSHGIAYLYNNAGAAWKTQQHVREILASQFHLGPSGLPGNDDAGQMSAWVVLSAMGFYPYCPGIPRYTVGSPWFTRVAIHQDNGATFTVLAPGNAEDHPFIRNATVNGKPLLKGMQFTHEDIVHGATLRLEMSATPNRDAAQQVRTKE